MKTKHGLPESVRRIFSFPLTGKSIGPRDKGLAFLCMLHCLMCDVLCAYGLVCRAVLHGLDVVVDVLEVHWMQNDICIDDC